MTILCCICYGLIALGYFLSFLDKKDFKECWPVYAFFAVLWPMAIGFALAQAEKEETHNG